MALPRRLTNLLRRNKLNREIEAELQSHLALRAESNQAQGMSPSEASRHARLSLGNPIALREQVLAADAALFLDSIVRDLRYALRQLRHSPAFTAVALITLALGIGANVTVFGVLNALLLKPLPIRDPGNLYQIRHQQWSKGRLLTTTYLAYQDLLARNTTFTGLIGIYTYSHAQLNWQNNNIQAAGDEVTTNYFDLLGIQPQRGRLFHASDDHGPNSAPYIVLSDALWHTAFHADPSVIGTTLEFDQHPFTILGIAPPAFHGTERFAYPDYWIPILNQLQTDGWDALHSRTSVILTVLGRLKPNVTPQQATDNLNAIQSQLAQEYPDTDEDIPLRLIHPGLMGDEGDIIRHFLWTVSVLALLVLAAACANLATLFAARAADRTREFALRMALGSTRQRLLRQMLTEAILISLLGGAAGLATAFLLLRLTDHWNSPLGHIAISVDPRVYLAGLALTLTTAILFGILPARQALHHNPAQAIKSNATASNPATRLPLRGFAFRDLLLGLQITICTLLVIASLVAVQGLIRTLQTPLGFHPENAMLVDLDLSQPGQPALSDTQLIQKQIAILQAASTIPGITAAGSINRTPFTGGLHGIPIFPPGSTEFKLNNAELATYVYQISPGYLSAAGTQLLSGRDLTWHDTANSPFVAIINQAFANKLWPRTSAIGQHFVIAGNLTQVVGIAETGKYHDLQESPQPAVYLPLLQSPQSETDLILRSTRPSKEITAAIAQTLSRTDPNLQISIQTWSDSLTGELFPAKAAAAALGTMGLLAILLALTGIFGTAAYAVSRRMKELGIRLALGARKPQLLRAAIGRPILILATGSIAGLAAGLAATPLLQQIVDQAQPADPKVLLGTVLTMTLIGTAATALPARRALQADPSKLMRED